jgi:type IV secretory pathway VirB10-like protein
MTLVSGVSVVGVGCALLISWFTGLPCAAQHASPATAQSELTHFGMVPDGSETPAPTADATAAPSAATTSAPPANPSRDDQPVVSHDDQPVVSHDDQPVVSHVVARDESVTNPGAEAEASQRRQHAWMFALAGTGAAFATSFVLTNRFSTRLDRASMADLDRSKEMGLDADLRSRARRQSLAGELRADLLQKVSDVCLAGSVAATGAALLIWLTGRRARADRQSNKTLLGPMVLRGASGAGIVLREKF